MGEIDIQQLIEQYLILLLGVKSKPIPSRFHLQKEMFILLNTIPRLQQFIKFRKHYYGPHSLDIKEHIDEPLYFSNPFKIHSNQRIELTKSGKEIYEKLNNEFKDNPKFQKIIKIMFY